MVEYGFEQKSFQSNEVRILVVTLCLGVIFIWAMVLSPDHGGLTPTPLRKELLIDFINVGQGDAVLIRTPRGRNFLVDGGMVVPPSQAKNENRELVSNYLRKVGVKTLQGVVVTHFHNDHLGGLIPVLKQMKVEKVWDPGGTFNTETYKDYVDLYEKKRIPHFVTRAGDKLDWGEELSVCVLHPAYESKSVEFSDVNNTSVTLLIRYGLVNTLLTGDIEEVAQKEVARYENALKSQIMKLPHHGSDTSIYKPFINFVSPDYGVIEVGRGNPFGHPTPAAINLYSQRGVQLYRTDHHGTVRLIIGGSDSKDFTFLVDRNL